MHTLFKTKMFSMICTATTIWFSKPGSSDLMDVKTSARLRKLEIRMQ